MTIFKIINKDWTDNVIIDFKNMKLVRESMNTEKANIQIKNNLLIVKWDKWETEYYAEFNKSFYNLKEVQFKTLEWEEICYIDYTNNIIYKPNENKKAFLNNINSNYYEIIWTLNNNSLLKNILNISNIQNNQTKLTKRIHSNNNLPIPNIIHFVYGFKPQTTEFELYKYLAIKSALLINNPSKIYFHYKYEPYGYYWDQIKHSLTLEYVEPPSEIYGNQLTHYAHQSDVIRLQKLQKYGGIYLDIDTICLKSFEELRKYDLVLGVQSNQNDSEIYGICNAVMMCKAQHEFIIEWIDTYTSFRSIGRDEYWDEHSVLMPLHLVYKYVNQNQNQNQNHIKILNSNNFFYPLWYSINDILFNTNIDIKEYKKIINNNFCIHLWDTYSHDYLSSLTPEKILNTNTIYNLLTRKFISNKISIVFLTYNRTHTLKDCLESYLPVLQNENICELLIFDNNSDQETKDFLNNFKNKHDKIQIFFHHENIGVCPGRIQLFKKAKGDIICSLDSDAKLLNPDFFNIIKNILYDEKYGIIGISGSYINSWKFQDQTDIENDDMNDYYCHHISGCCQIFRKELFNVGFGLDPNYGFFWCEDTDLSMQTLNLNKINYRISGKDYIFHQWGGSGKNYHELFIKNWEYLKNKWKNKIEFGKNY